MFLKNQKGAALVFIMLVLLVLSVLGTAVLGTVVSNHQLTIKDRDFQSVYYIAEAGVTYQTEVFREEVLTAYGSTGNLNAFYNAVETYIGTNTMNSFETIQGNQPTATITIDRISPLYSNPSTYTITSFGIIDGMSRTVSKDLTVQWVSNIPFDFQTDMAVFSLNNIELTGSAMIGGPLGTNALGTNAINVSGNPSIEDIYVLPGAEMSGPSTWEDDWADDGNSQFVLSEARTYEMPEFPSYPVYDKLEDFVIINGVNSHTVINNGNVNITHYLAHNYTLNLNQNAYIPEININSNQTLKINVGSTDKKIVVDKINLNSGFIELLGTGKLTIYLKDNIYLTAGSSINKPTDESDVTLVNATVNQLLLYYNGTSPIEMTGSQKIYGSIYAETADINIGNGAGFLGHIVTGGSNVKIGGGTYIATSLLYAPNAAVQVVDGANVRGPIVSNTFTMNGGASVIYDPSVGIGDNPFSGGAVGIDDLIPTQGAIREQ